MSKFEKIQENLANKIPQMANFRQTSSDSEILIAENDSDSTSYILSDVDKVNKSCRINNTASVLDISKVFSILNSEPIIFIPIDGGKGLLGGSSNCDFTFFNEQDFCFVELKLNAISSEERAIRKNRKKAIKQLISTIAYFDTTLALDYSGLNLEAFVSTPDVYPHENTAWQSFRVEFLEETGIDLYEKREKRY